MSDGYITNDKTIKINVLQSGIGLNEYFSEDSWSLYPNPAKNQVEVALQTPQATAVNLSVHSLAGTMILARKNLSTVAGTTVFSLSTQQWAKGTYLIKISDAAGNFSSKLLMVQ
ncbi:MAG: T9SS type A sorting domain-containing protein [Owenweeksia sp.]|nr:T9SS type A sorting domain-containing protein [Owenweeksia sp.]